MADEQQIHVDDFTPDPVSAPDLSRYDKYKVSTAPAPTKKPPVNTTGQTISANPKPWYSRITEPFTGENTAYGLAKKQREESRFSPIQKESILSRPLVDISATHPEDATTNPVARGVVKGVTSTLSGLTTPQNAAMLIGLYGAEAVPVISKLIGLGFSADMLHGVYQSVPRLREQIKSGDVEGATQTATEMGLGTAMAGAAAVHGVKGKAQTETKPETRPTKTTPPTFAAPPTPDLSKYEQYKLEPTPPAPTPPVEPQVAPEIPKKSLNEDVKPVRGTYPPQPEPAEQVPQTETTSSEERPAEPERAWQKGDPIPDYGQVVNIDPKILVPKPSVYQYKSEAIGKGGTTPEFYDVKEWDPGLGGAMAVWFDPSTGEISPVNGHHRTEIAQRVGAPSVNVRFIPAKTPEEARTWGAMLNIGEGKGTAIDAAKLFRDTGATPADLAKYKISPTSKLAVQGMGLSKLDPSIFQQVVDEKMTATRGALIGDLLEGDFAAQKAAVDFFKKAEKNGKRYNNAEASDIIRSIKETPDQTETIEDLFGFDEVKKNLFGERAEVSAGIAKRLGKEKSLFKLVSKQSVAEKLSGAGNILNSEENAKISQEAAQVLAVYDKLKFSAGPVADALNEAAKEVANGTDIDIATEKAYERIKEAVQGELSGKPKAAATPAPEKPAAAAAEAESGVSGPNAGEPVKADSGGSGAGVEDNEVAQPKEEDFTPDPVTKPVELGPEEPKQPKKPLDLSIYKLGNIIHDTAWKEDLKIVNLMSMGGTSGTSPKMEYQVIPVNQLEPDGSVPMSGGNKWWISPDERYELKEEAPNKSAKKEEFEPEPEPKKPETPLHPVGTILKTSYGDYYKVLESEPSGKITVIGINPKTGKPWLSTESIELGDPVTYSNWTVENLPEPKSPAPAAPPAPKASQAPVAVSAGPTKEPPTLKGYKKKIGIPKKYEDNDDLKLKLFGATNSNSIPSTDIIPTKIAVMNLITPKLAHLPAPKGLEDIYYESNGQNLNEHQKAVAGLIHSWASTSADSDKHSLVVQIAAQKEFGLALDWDFKKGNSAYEEVLNEAYNIYGKAGTFIRQFLRTQYQETQAYFKQNGVKEVVAYRGMSFNFDYGDPSNPFKVEAGSFKKHQASKVQLQPLSSFSFDAEIAAGFSGGNMGALIAGVIPVGRILSTPKTGMGCLREFELVVLSGDSANNKMAGVSWNKLKATQYLPLDERIDMLKVLLEEVASKETGKPKKSNAGPKVSGKVSKPTD